MGSRGELVVSHVRVVENGDGVPERITRGLVLARLQLGQGLLVDLDDFTHRVLALAGPPRGHGETSLQRQGENE